MLVPRLHVRVRGVKRPARRMRSLGALAMGAARVAVSVSVSVPGGWVAAGPGAHGSPWAPWAPMGPMGPVGPHGPHGGPRQLYSIHVLIRAPGESFKIISGNGSESLELLKGILQNPVWMPLLIFHHFQ